MESKQVLAIVKEIQTKVDSMDNTLEYLLKIEGKTLIDAYIAEFKTTKLLKEVYLHVDGKISQNEMLSIIKAEINDSSDVPVSQPTISRRIDKLKEMGLIFVVDSKVGSPVHAKSKIEKIFRLSDKIK